MLILLPAFGVCSVRKDLFVQFTAYVLVLDISLCQATALQLAELTFAGMVHLSSHNEYLLDLVAFWLLGQTWGLGTCLLCGLARALPWQCLLLVPLWVCLADPTLCHASLMDRNKHAFLAGSLALDGRLLVLLSLSRRSRFMPEQSQDVLLAVASMACGGLHILLRLLSLHLCNEYPSPPQKTQKKTNNALTRQQV